MLVALLILLMTSVAFGQPAPVGGGVISDLGQLRPDLCEDSQLIQNNNQLAWLCADPPTTTTSGAILDLGDDASNESTGIAEVATTGDTNSIFTESAPDKLLIDVGQNWPVADAATTATTATSATSAAALSADPSDCLSGSAPVGIDATGAAVDCMDYEEDLSNSAGLAAALSDETGTGAVVFGTAPTLDSPALITPVVSLPDGSVGAPTADGVIEYDRTTERLQVGDGSGTSEFVKVGTLADTQLCTWDAMGNQIDCNTSSPPTVVDSVQSGDIAARDAYFTSPAAGDMWQVDDGIAGAECTTGGGALVTLCIHDGTAWIPVPIGLTDGSVSNNHLADMSQNTIKGRVLGGSGPPADLSASESRAVMGLATTDAVTFDSVSTTATDNPTFTVGNSTAGESQWYHGTNHDGGGDDNDPWELRQSSTPGVNVRVSVNTNGEMSLPGGFVDARTCGLDASAALVSISAQCANQGIFYNGDNDAIEFDLPAAASLKSFCFHAGGFAQVITISPDAADTITLNGMTASAGEGIVSSGVGSEFICLHGRDDSAWVSWGVNGTWAEESP